MAKRWLFGQMFLSNFGKEDKCRGKFRTTVSPSKSLQDQNDEVTAFPTERGDRGSARQRKSRQETSVMPGYVLVHMEMSDRGYH